MVYEFEDNNKPPLIKRILKELLVVLIEMIIVIGIAYGVIHFMVEKTQMVGSSMESTLSAGDEILINKLAYRFKDPSRFDVVVFKQSGKEHSYYNIKRIIGLPGETVQVIDGAVYIDGVMLEEQVNVELINNAGLAQETITLDENEYFVLGDNRNNSEDSRFANIGNVVRDEIVGKAWLRINNPKMVSKLNLIGSESSKKSSSSSDE